MTLVHFLITLYIWVLIVAALLSWVPTGAPDGGMATTKRILARLTEPILYPLRQILPRPNLGGIGIDLSVLVAVVVLQIVNVLI